MKNTLLYVATGLLAGAMTLRSWLNISAENQAFYQPADCEPTYIQHWGRPGIDEEGSVLLATPDGSLYLGASSQTIILIRFNSDGAILSQRFIDISPSQSEVITSLIMDSDGMLVGAGYSGLTLSSARAFAFRYDPVSGNILWSRIFNRPSKSYQLLERTDGDFMILGESIFSPNPGEGDDALMILLDRDSGQPAPNGPNYAYNFGSSEMFNANLIHNGSLYTLSRCTNGSAADKMRAVLSRFDLNGNEIWSKPILQSFNGSARMYGRDILTVSNGFILALSGNDNSNSITQTNLFLANTDFNGNLLWAKKYDLPAYANEWTEEVIQLNDGYLMLGYIYTGNEQDLFLVKTNLNGAPLWAKSYGGPGIEYLRFEQQSQLIALGDYFYFTGWTVNAATGDKSIFLGKVDQDGNISSQENCPLVTTREIVVSDVANVPTGTIGLSRYGFDISYVDYPFPLVQGSVSATSICQQECLTCTTDTTAVNLTICQGDVVTIFGMPVANSGIYSQTFTNTAGCDSVHIVHLENYPPPVLEITTTPACNTGGNAIASVSGGNPPYQVNWSTGAQNTLSIDNLPPGNYSATVTDSCNSLSVSLFNVPECNDPQDLKVYVPNAFSPNSDGINDEFTAYTEDGAGVILQMSIFHRWGGLVFERLEFAPNDPRLGWNGKWPSGKPAEAGVYTYLIKINLINGDTRTLAGDVVLVR